MDRKKPKWPYFLAIDVLLLCLALWLVYAGGLKTGNKKTAMSDEDLTEVISGQIQQETETAVPEAVPANIPDFSIRTV